MCSREIQRHYDAAQARSGLSPSTSERGRYDDKDVTMMRYLNSNLALQTMYSEVDSAGTAYCISSRETLTKRWFRLSIDCHIFYSTRGAKSR